MPSSSADTSRTADYLTAGHVDGAILVSLHGDDPLPARLAAAGVPTVVGGWRPSHGVSASYVDVDNRGGARSAVEHLIAGGRRTIATITGPSDMAPGIDRLNGYREALEEAGLDASKDLVAVGDFSQESAAPPRWRRCSRPDRTSTRSSPHRTWPAAGAMGVLLAAGRRIPEDVALAGFDDSAVASTLRPQLTSVRQPIEEMGHELARLLIDAVEGSDPVPRRVILATELIRRASSAGRRMP